MRTIMPKFSWMANTSANWTAATVKSNWNSPPAPKVARLDILVEAMGRINFGRAIKDFKGITQSVELTVDIDGPSFHLQPEGLGSL